MKGVCGKINRRNVNGQKPCMILAACILQTLKVSEVYSSSDNVDDSLNYSCNSSVLPVTVNSDKVFLVALWLKLAPPTKKSEIIGKWFARIYTVGKKSFAISWVGHQNISTWQ